MNTALPTSTCITILLIRGLLILIFLEINSKQNFTELFSELLLDCYKHIILLT